MIGTLTNTAPIESSEQLLSSSRLLGSSIGSLSSPRQASSNISKTYKQASSLFLTRRLPEALSALEPILAATVPSDPATSGDEETPKQAPIAGAKESSRIKVWNLYLTLLNTIIELGPDDGRAAFGSREWRNLVAKVQDGSIWEEVVQIGYGGFEGNLDADVVVSLATLLLSQSASQVTNQQRLESYLSTSTQPNVHLTDPFSSKHNTNGQDNTLNSPRDLASRTKILELYTLHVLPRNSEWAYAKELITLSEVLNEETRDTFLQALRALEDEKSKDDQCEANDMLAQDAEDGRKREQEEQRKLEEAKIADEKWRRQQQPSNHHRRRNSEKDYGIDASHPSYIAKISPPPTKTPSKPPTSKESQPSRLPRSPRTTSPKKPLHSSIYNRSAALLANLQYLISNMATSMSKNPMSLLRFVLFLTGLIVALSRRDVKDRVGRITGQGWDKVKRTVGMGVKVSYI